MRFSCAAAPQQHGYEVYVAHAPEADPVKCHERNIHKRSLQDIQQAAAAWQPLPPLYTQLDVKALTKPEPAGGAAPGVDLPLHLPARCGTCCRASFCAEQDAHATP